MATGALDNQDAMRKVDKENMLDFCTNMAQHYHKSIKNAEKIRLDYGKPENVIISGMGGSGIGGELLKDYTRGKIQVPLEVNRGYNLPAYVDTKSLVVLVSYSGETEETLSTFLDAVQRKCRIFCLTSGGTLLNYAEKLGLPHLQVPSGMPPRAALPYLLVPLLSVMEQAGMISGTATELSETTKLLSKICKENSPEKPAVDNSSKMLALNLNGVSPVVYGFGIYRSVAMRFKQQFNENSKVPAKWETFSELNHNEIVGWESGKKIGKNYATVFIRDKAEPAEVRSRIEITKTLLQPSVPNIFEVWTQGKSELAKMISTICIGDFTSVYLALLHRVNPTPVKTINLLKEKQEQAGVRDRVVRELEKIASK